MSVTVASALQFIDEERTKETRQFICMIDLFFDALNVKNILEGKMKRKSFSLPYYTPPRLKIQGIIYVHTVTITYQIIHFIFSVAGKRLSRIP